jgi:hypothetical protein
MATIDEVEELRAELAHCHLTAQERRGAEAWLAATPSIATAQALAARPARHERGNDPQPHASVPTHIWSWCTMPLAN